MSLAKNVLGIVPGLQAMALVSHNIPKSFPMKATNIAKPTKNLLVKSVGTIAGVALIKPTASMINAL